MLVLPVYNVKSGVINVSLANLAHDLDFSACTGLRRLRSAANGRLSPQTKHCWRDCELMKQLCEAPAFRLRVSMTPMIQLTITMKVGAKQQGAPVPDHCLLIQTGVQKFQGKNHFFTEESLSPNMGGKDITSTG